MACCIHWVRETSIVWFVVCSLQCGYTTSDEKNIYLNNSQLNWWEARANCRADKGDLFVPVTEPEPSRLSGTRNRSTYYWLGAMRYSTWIWTDDGSPLYINSGLSILPDDLEAAMTFPDNSVYRCQGHCRSNHHTLGLSKDRCFCLGDDYEGSRNTSGEPCPGNPDEVCGYADRMSVYKRPFEDFTGVVFIPTGNAQCGNAIQKDGELTILLDNSDICKTSHRRYACYKNGIANRSPYSCSGKVCVSHIYRIWTEANDQCYLVKPNSSIVEDLMEEMSSNRKYWIGLVYRSTKKWITGQEVSVHDENSSFTSSSEPQCLAVSFKTWYPHLSWKPCSYLCASICEVVGSTTSTTTTTQQHSSSPAATAGASETPTYRPTGNVPTSEHYMSTSTNNPEVGPAEPVTASQETQTGVFIGLGCVVLILVGIIVVLLLSRQNKLCFKRKDDQQSMHFNTVTQNTTSDLEVPNQTNTSAYTDITLADMADVKPVSSAVPRVRPRVQNYEHTFPSDGDENAYNVLSPPGKHHAPGTSGKPINNLPGPVNGDYDTAQARIQGSGSTGLNNSGPSAATRAPMIYQGDNDVVGQHDPGGAAEVPGHLRDGEGGHATSQQGKTPREVDDSYSHNGRTNKGFEENAYDVASTRQTEDRRDDTYNHTDSVDDNAGDTNGYYNTRSLFRDKQRETCSTR